MPLLRALPAALPALLTAVPAHASGGVVLPEPSSMLLFTLGTAGVVIGRKLSAKRPRK
ncbi:PEP-CTERM sorting domain-containing protein [Novosphingobium colocasiae]|uniref:PEP-CTERM sorting domain-containing protein n=1 Tax=Novosphingobium colocasiae TaxID=1256513 RepID=UPI0035B16605